MQSSVSNEAGVRGEDHLVIVSVPYLRVARTLLSDAMLNAIGAADVLVVSPFADDANFRAEYARPGMKFLRLAPPPRLPQPQGMLYSLSEIMRMQGFWRRYRNRGLGYYWRVSGVQFSGDGEDQRDSFARRCVSQLGAMLGTWPRAWKLLDRLIGHTLYSCDGLGEITSRYESITLVQASSWGFQDRLLGWHARGGRYRPVLVPYTTDQLWVNGYLICEYDAVCVQGPFEERCARHYHAVPESRVVRLGSMWFRAVDDFAARIGLTAQRRAATEPRTVLYAGVSCTYFPRHSEFQAVDALLGAARSGALGNTRIVYRPYAVNPEDRTAVTARYAAEADLELQWPEEACAGLDGYSGQQIEPQLVQYLRRLSAADVVVMSHTTSLGWDAAYLGCGVIANFADETGTLERRGTGLRFSADGRLDCAPGLPVARSVDELLAMVRRQLAEPEALANSRARIVGEWDFPRPDWRARLSDSLSGAEQPGQVCDMPVSGA